MMAEESAKSVADDIVGTSHDARNNEFSDNTQSNETLDIINNQSDKTSDNIRGDETLDNNQTDEKTEEADKSEIYQCDKCDYFSYKKQYYKQHVDRVHSNQRPFKCPFCDYAGKRQQSLKEHLIVHSNEKPYECTRCNASFRKKGHLTKHVQMHSKRAEIRCHFCMDLFVNTAVMTEHIRVEHADETLYMCEICQLTVPSKDEILLHFAAKHDQTIFKCSLCKFLCQTENEMTEHQTRKHKAKVTVGDFNPNKTNFKPFIMKCSECGFTTPIPETLQQHMKIHLDVTHAVSADVAKQSEKPKTLYKCFECGYYAQDSHTFVSHISSHKPQAGSDSKSVDEPPKKDNFTLDQSTGKYVCSLCSYSCTQQRTIKAHIWKHSGHKDVNYPMFRNGPLSVFEGSVANPIYETTIASSTETNPPVSKPILTVPVSGTTIPREYLVPVKVVKNTANIIDNKETPLIAISSKQESGEAKILTKSAASGAYQKILHVVQSANNSKPTNLKLIHMDSNESNMNDVLRQYCSSGASVIVEPNVPHFSQNLTGLRSQQSSPRVFDQLMEQRSDEATEIVSEQQKAKDSTTENLTTDKQVMKCDYNTRSKGQVTQDASTDRTEIDDSIEEPALTLLSLLKQGPNINPACPPSAGNYPTVISERIRPNMIRTRSTSLANSSKGTCSTPTESIDNDDASSNAETESIDSDSRKSKAGICSSLLAVIEQLHERSKYDTEVEIETVSESGGVKSTPNRRSYKRKLKEVNEEEISIENIENVERTNDSTVKYRCKLCHYSNSCVSVLKQHMRLHKTKKPFECSLCDFVGEANEALQDHMILHCKVRMYQCKVCDSAFSYKSQLRAHMRAHVDRVPFVCKHCTYATSDAKTFRDHVYAHFAPNTAPACGDVKEKEVVPAPAAVETIETTEMDAEDGDPNMNEGDEINEKGVKCPHCPFVFTTYSGMKLHARMHLIELQPLKCAMCEFYAVSNRSLKSHMKRHVNDQRYVQQPLEQYRCDICGYVCHHLPSLKSHMWRHASNRNYSYEFTNEVINKAIDYDLRIDGMTHEEKEEIMKNMMRVESRGDMSCFVTFVCCQCGFETIDKASLGSHMNIHADIIQQTFDIGQYHPVVENESRDAVANLVMSE